MTANTQKITTKAKLKSKTAASNAKSAKTAEAVEIAKLRKEYTITKINIKAGKEKNTNAHKAIKKQIAQKLTKLSINQ